ALFDGFLDDRMVVEHWPLHLVGQREFHGIALDKNGSEESRANSNGHARGGQARRSKAACFFLLE
ncbi:MAG: hypothetical protein J4O10_03115, partial [Chloroflexi bacterium]|nr:hypothetical protein [Chloroflexota bacterium]